MAPRGVGRIFDRMIQIGRTLISEELFTEAFQCDLEACKGACCVEGDAGAPLELEEADLLEQEYAAIAPYLLEEGKAAIEQQGKSVIDSDGDLGTPLVNGGACAYAVFEGGKALCGIEQAWKAGDTPFRKPVSCHLYPVRIQSYQSFDAVNYHRWNICSPACALGRALQQPVFVFLKDALIRRFGAEWYAELEEVYQLYRSEKG
jgi:hypothetical protein